MSETGLEAKQQYLRVNILEAGYDPQAFFDYCSKTHDLDDLENWSMNELVQITQNFIAQFNPQPQIEEHDQFGGFQQAAKQSHSSPAPQAKLGLVFTDDDWKQFLAGSTLPQQKSSASASGASHIPTDLLFDFGFGGTAGSTIQQAVKPKESPLSPPSTVQGKSSSDPRKSQIESTKQRAGQQQKGPSMASMQKVDKKKPKDSKETNAINLSNIKIVTAKQKLQPLLPLINDVVVTKTEQISRNFLQSDCTLYHISFPPTQHVVKRRFADLRKVRMLLQKYYPFLRLPYLEPEGWLNSSEGRDPQTLIKYKWMVEEFIKYCLLKSKELKDCELVRILCGFSLNGEKDDLKKKIQTLEHGAKPKLISDVLLSDNSFVIPPVCGCDRLITNTTNLLGQIDVQYEKLRKQMDNLFSTYDLLSKNYTDITATFEVLEGLTKKYNFDNNQAADIRLYEGLKEMTVKLANQINGDFNIFKCKIKNLLLYEKSNMTTLKEIFEARNKIHYEFQKQGSPPFSSNSMRIQGSNVQIQSPVPLDEPIKNNKNTLALQEAFWSFVVSRETSRYWQHLRRKISQHLTLIAYDQLDSENQNLNFWNSMIKRCVV